MPVTKREKKRKAQEAIVAAWNEKNAARATEFKAVLRYVDTLPNIRDAMKRVHEETVTAIRYSKDIILHEGKIDEGLYNHLHSSSGERLMILHEVRDHLAKIAPEFSYILDGLAAEREGDVGAILELRTMSLLPNAEDGEDGQAATVPNRVEPGGELIRVAREMLLRNRRAEGMGFLSQMEALDLATITPPVKARKEEGLLSQPEGTPTPPVEARKEDGVGFLSLSEDTTALSASAQKEEGISWLTQPEDTITPPKDAQNSPETSWLVLTAPPPHTEPGARHHSISSDETIVPVFRGVASDEMAREISLLRTRSERQDKAIKRLKRKNSEIENRQAILEVQNTLDLRHQIAGRPSEDDNDAPSAERMEAALRKDLSAAFDSIKGHAIEFMNETSDEVVGFCRTMAEKSTQASAEAIRDESETAKVVVEKTTEMSDSGDEIAVMKERLLRLEIQLEKLGLTGDKMDEKKDEKKEDVNKGGTEENGDAKKSGAKKKGKKKK